MTYKTEMTVRQYIESNAERKALHQGYLAQFLSDEYDADNDLLLQAIENDGRRDY